MRQETLGESSDQMSPWEIKRNKQVGKNKICTSLLLAHHSSHLVHIFMSCTSVSLYLVTLHILHILQSSLFSIK